MTLKFIFDQHVFATGDCDFALQRRETAYCQARSEFSKREVYLLKVAFNDTGFIEWIPATSPVFSYANVWVLETGTGEVNEAGQLFAIKEKVSLVVIATGKYERRMDDDYLLTSTKLPVII